MMSKVMKIKLVREGYLPNYPYHLISEEEMCEAFLHPTKDEGYFFDNYPCLAPTLLEPYQDLVAGIREQLRLYCLSQFDPNKIETLPDWVKSYMVGSTISVNSNPLDIHELLVGLNCDNLEDNFTEIATVGCYHISKSWIQRYAERPETRRPPTLFGEPHVMKALRLAQGAGYRTQLQNKLVEIVEGE